MYWFDESQYICQFTNVDNTRIILFYAYKYLFKIYYLPPVVDSKFDVISPLVVGVPVPPVSVELNASVGPLVSPAVVEDAAKRTIHNKYVYIIFEN